MAKNMTKGEVTDYANKLIKPTVKASDALSGGLGGLVSNVSPEELDRLAEDYELNCPVVTLAQGQKIEGVLLGAGPILEQKKKDPVTGKVGEPIETWKFGIGDVRACIFASHQLGLPSEMEMTKRAMMEWDTTYGGRTALELADAPPRPAFRGDLPQHVGKEVFVIRGADVNVGSRRITKFVTGVRRESRSDS